MQYRCACEADGHRWDKVHKDARFGSVVLKQLEVQLLLSVNSGVVRFCVMLLTEGHSESASSVSSSLKRSPAQLLLC